MASDVPINSWNDLSTRIQRLWLIRNRYIRTQDPPPVMNYVQLIEALPANYNLPPGRKAMAERIHRPTA